MARPDETGLAARPDHDRRGPGVHLAAQLLLGRGDATALHDDGPTRRRQLGGEREHRRGRDIRPHYNTASVGGFAANKVAMIDFLTLAFLAIAIVRRHTRGEEESGRFELLGATPVGRLAPLGAAMILASVTSFLSGVGTIPAVIAGGWPVGGSI